MIMDLFFFLFSCLKEIIYRWEIEKDVKIQSSACSLLELHGSAEHKMQVLFSYRTKAIDCFEP